MTTHSQNLTCGSLVIPSGRMTQDLQYFIGVQRKQSSPRAVNSNREKHLYPKAQIPTHCSTGESPSWISPWINYAEHFQEQRGELLTWLLLPDCPWIQWDVPSASRTTGTRRAEGWLQQSALLIQHAALHSLSFFLSLLALPEVRRYLKSYCPVLVLLFQAATQGRAAGAFGCKIITEWYDCLW